MDDKCSAVPCRYIRGDMQMCWPPGLETLSLFFSIPDGELQ